MGKGERRVLSVVEGQRFLPVDIRRRTDLLLPSFGLPIPPFQSMIERKRKSVFLRSFSLVRTGVVVHAPTASRLGVRSYARCKRGRGERRLKMQSEFGGFNSAGSFAAPCLS
jgi:hypothetical protein